MYTYIMYIWFWIIIHRWDILLYCPLASTGSPDMAQFLDRHLSGKSRKFVLYWFTVGPMLAFDYHWASVADSGPTLKHHRVGVFSLLGFAAFPANTRRWPNAGPPSTTLDEHNSIIGSTSCVCWVLPWIVVNDVADIIPALARTTPCFMSRPSVFVYSRRGERRSGVITHLLL